MNENSTKRLASRGLGALAGVVVVIAVLAGCVSTAQQSALDLLNRDRASVGLPALAASDQLMTKAQGWADKLAASGTLSHSVLTQGVSGCYKSLGENVGKGTNITAVEKSWIADTGINPPIHRNNIQSRSFDHVGIGVTVKNGVYYVVQVFEDVC